MRVGDLRHRVQLVAAAATPAQSGFGTDITPKAVGKTVWAAIKPLTAKENQTVKTLFITASHKITMRYEAAKALTQRSQIKFKGRTFVVDQLINVDERNRWIEATVTEQK